MYDVHLLDQPHERKWPGYLLDGVGSDSTVISIWTWAAYQPVHTKLGEARGRQSWTPEMYDLALPYIVKLDPDEQFVIKKRSEGLTERQIGVLTNTTQSNITLSLRRIHARLKYMWHQPPMLTTDEWAAVAPHIGPFTRLLELSFETTSQTMTAELLTKETGHAWWQSRVCFYFYKMRRWVRGRRGLVLYRSGEIRVLPAQQILPPVIRAKLRALFKHHKWRILTKEINYKTRLKNAASNCVPTEIASCPGR